MNYTFGTITQNFIKNVMKNNNTCVLLLVMFYETRRKNETKYFIELICFIYTIIYNCVYIDYLACQSNKLSVICMDRNYLRKI